MSEIIYDKKKEQIKEVLKGLNEGSDINRIRKKFKSLLKSVSPEEIAEMEQSLMEEGTPVEEIQQLCDIHASVFQETLNKQKKSKTIAGHPIHSYRMENREAKKVLKKFLNEVKSVNGDNLQNKIENLKVSLGNISEIEIHYQRKENQLFPYLENVSFNGPTKVMWGKHDEIRLLFKEISGSIENMNLPDLKKKAQDLKKAVKNMIFLEEKILFPTAMRKLTEKSWIEIRKGESEIGYSWITPGNIWDPTVVGSKEINLPTEPAQEQANKGDSLIQLSTGGLNMEQIDLMLKNLPLDLSFVDENDRVQYYTNGKERIFPRSPGIIGRTIQNCHPPKSVHIVDQIVTSFKNKTEESAEFWLEMNGKFIHIRYFPLYNEKGDYKGVIEVSQDVSEIRELKGEKRLLD